MTKKKEPCDCPQEILDLLSQGKTEEAMRKMWEYENKNKKR